MVSREEQGGENEKIKRIDKVLRSMKEIVFRITDKSKLKWQS